jgi:hypothetical protein
MASGLSSMPKPVRSCRPKRSNWRRPVGVEQPRRAPAQAGAGVQVRPAILVGQQQLGRFEPGQFGFQRIRAGHFVDEEAPAGQIGPGQPVAVPAACHGHQQVSRRSSSRASSVTVPG